MLNDCTLMVKTLIRQDCLVRFLESVRQFYPTAPLWVADDSPEPYPEVAEGDPHTQYHTFPYDIGIGHCLNWMVDRITTKYVVLLEDDFIFTERTKIEKLLVWLEAGVFDLIGGDVWNLRREHFQGFVGRFTRDDNPSKLDYRTIGLKKVRRETVVGAAEVEVTMNFWAARTESLREVRWDEKLKVCRHEDFFMRFIGYRPNTDRVPGFRAGFTPNACIDHQHKQDRIRGLAHQGDQRFDYGWHRRGRFPGPEGRQAFIDKWGFEFI